MESAPFLSGGVEGLGGRPFSFTDTRSSSVARRKDSGSDFLEQELRNARGLVLRCFGLAAPKFSSSSATWAFA